MKDGIAMLLVWIAGLIIMFGMQVLTEKRKGGEGHVEPLWMFISSIFWPAYLIFVAFVMSVFCLMWIIDKSKHRISK